MERRTQEDDRRTGIHHCRYAFVLGHSTITRPRVSTRAALVAPFSGVKSTRAITEASWISGRGWGTFTHTSSSRWTICCSPPGSFPTRFTIQNVTKAQHVVRAVRSEGRVTGPLAEYRRRRTRLGSCHPWELHFFPGVPQKRIGRSVRADRVRTEPAEEVGGQCSRIIDRAPPATSSSVCHATFAAMPIIEISSGVLSRSIARR